MTLSGSGVRGLVRGSYTIVRGSKRRKVARSKRRDRNRAQKRLRLTNAFAFVVEEEKQPVLAIEELRNLHRAAHIEAELIQLERRDRIFRASRRNSSHPAPSCAGTHKRRRETDSSPTYR